MQTTVWKDFIREALRDRRETCKERDRCSDEEENLFDRFVELVCECWCRENDTPSSLVDNRCINWYSGTYEEFIENYLSWDEIEEYKEMLENEDYDTIEERIMDEWWDYDRENLMYHI